MTTLEKYLSLEQEMIQLDEAEDPIADIRAESVRDAMDEIWYSALTIEEKAWLNDRDMEK